MKKILLVEDEKPIRDMLRFALANLDFKLLEAGTAKKAVKIIHKKKPDLILMDWMLPDKSGIELTRSLNKHNYNIPIIMLTARSEKIDKIKGLEAGADDYVSKPFSVRELIARINAVLRRTYHTNKKEKNIPIKFGALKLDEKACFISIEKMKLQLGPKEFKLLSFFMKNPNRVYSRGQLLDYVWGRNVYIEERTVDVYVRRLRKLLAAKNCDQLIHTVRSVGYRFATD